MQNVIICHYLNAGKDLLSTAPCPQGIYLFCHLNPGNCNTDNSTWWQNRPILIRIAFPQLSVCRTQPLRKLWLQTCKGQKHHLLGPIDRYCQFENLPRTPIFHITVRGNSTGLRIKTNVRPKVLCKVGSRTAVLISAELCFGTAFDSVLKTSSSPENLSDQCPWYDKQSPYVHSLAKVSYTTLAPAAWLRRKPQHIPFKSQPPQPHLKFQPSNLPAFWESNIQFDYH